jgi:hypothetical protein
MCCRVQAWTDLADSLRFVGNQGAFLPSLLTSSLLTSSGMASNAIMSNLLKVVAAAVLILALLWLMVPAPQAPQPVGGMPWQIEVFEDGSSKALGLHLGQDSLRDAVRLLGRPEGLSLFSPQAEAQAFSLEAYFGTVRNGPLAAKLVLVLDASAEQMGAMAERALTRKPGPSGAYQWLLSEEDKQLAQEYRIRALTYIPLYAELDAEFFSSRFGQPAGRRALSDQVERWFYPDRGLSIDLDAKGKEVLHYVMPRDFSLSSMAPTRPDGH